MDGRLEISLKDFKKCDEIVMEMPDFIDDWYSNLRSSGKTAKTCRKYLTTVKDYFSTIDVPMYVTTDKLTSSSFNKYMISKQVVYDNNGNEKPSSKSYQNGIWSTLYNLFTFLEDEEYIKKNPIKKSSRPGGNDLDRINEHRVLLTKQDFRKIIKFADSEILYADTDYKNFVAVRNKAIIEIFMSTGIRESALCSLNIDSINYDENTLFVIDKGEIPHKYILPDECMIAINKWIGIRKYRNIKNNDAMFISNDGNRIIFDSVAKTIKRYTKLSLGKELSPHKLRAGVCSILYKETGDIEFVRRFIGHSDVSVTQRYVVTGKDEIEKGSKILGNIL